MKVWQGQINDSHIIMKRIVPWLTGKEMTDEEVMWEKRITYAACRK